ncbi:MAG TPA: LTA synthase family protein [Bacteroidia bacterium]
MLQTFFTGFIFDSCVSCCILLIALLFPLMALRFLRSKTIHLFSITVNILFSLALFINIVDVFYFNQFGTRMNMFAGEALHDPYKIISTAWKIYPVVRILLAYSVLVFIFIRVHGRLLKKTDSKERPEIKWAFFSIISLGALSFLYYGPPLWTLSCFSDSPVLNQASLNGVYTLVKSWDQQRIYDSDIPAWHYTSDEDALNILRDSIAGMQQRFAGVSDIPTLRSNTTTDSFRQKNVVIIILESFGSRFVGKMNEGKGFSPNFDRYCDSGMFFTHFHSNGPRTQNGIMSAVSGFPSILGNNLQRRKGVNEFHTLGNILQEKGYETRFLHNGHADYDDMDKFMRQGGFQMQLDVNDYSKWRMKNEWGVSDEDLYEKAYDMIWNTRGKPVLSVMLTMSNHEPHELPGEFRKQHPEVEKMDARQATFYYSDAALGSFLDKCSHHPQYRNTLFVIIADHGEAYGPEDNFCKIFHIPCLVLNAEQGKGVSMNTASQCDVPSTVLSQLHYSGNYHFIGQDMFSKEFHPFAFMHAYGSDLFLCRDSIMLKYYFENGKAEFYYTDRHHYQRTANDVPQEVQKKMIAFLQRYIQSITWIFRNGKYREK